VGCGSIQAFWLVSRNYKTNYHTLPKWTIPDLRLAEGGHTQRETFAKLSSSAADS